jgi:hypothetical protein
VWDMAPIMLPFPQAVLEHPRKVRAVQNCAVRCSTMEYALVQHGTVSMVHYSTMRHTMRLVKCRQGTLLFSELQSVNTHVLSHLHGV